MKKYSQFQEWVSRRMEDLCSRLTPQQQTIVTLVLFTLFTICSLFVMGDALYQMGKKDGRREQLDIKHIDSLPIVKPDSLKQIKPIKFENYG